jgi:hypothetical protein
MYRLLPCCFFIALLAASVAPVRAAPPAPLDEAIKKWIADEDHWAYTRHLRIHNSFKPVEERVERYDPSQPDDEQWQLLEIGGKAPGPDQLKAWRRQKTKELKRNNEKPLAEYFDFDHATVAAETAGSIRYDVPLRKEAYTRIPLDKIAVSVSVSKDRHELEGLTAGLKETFRMAMGAAKVTDFGVDISFKSIDAKFAPQPVTIKASGSARVILFFKVGGDADIGWSDFKRVKPFKERFDVKIGDLKALDF